LKPVPEPVYNGRPLSAWLKDFDLSVPGELTLSRSAQEAVRALGTNALPWLTRELIYMESQATYLRNYSGNKPTSYDRNDAALRAFLVLGPAAAPAVTNIARIFRVLDDYNNGRNCAIDALAAIGPEGVPVLLTGLKHPASETRRRCAAALAAIQPPATKVAAALVALLNDPDPVVRRDAARALGQLHTEAATVVPALLQAFRAATMLAANPPPRRTGVTHRLGRAQGVLVPWVLGLQLQIAVVEALGEFGPEAKDALPLFQTVLQTPAPADGYENDPKRNVHAAIQAVMPRIAGSNSQARTTRRN
jgi:hypothetical protein